MAEVTQHVPSGDERFARMRQDGDAALFMNCRDGFLHRHAFGDGLGDPQGDNMAFARGDLDAGDDVERVVRPVRICPQAGVQYVMVGDGNHIQATPFFHIVQDLLHCRKAIAGFGVHVDIGAACQLVEFQVGYSLVSTTTSLHHTPKCANFLLNAE
jgi:hypothetical protein